MDIRDLLQGLSVQYGLNLYLHPDVSGKISVNFNKLALVEALVMIIKENHYVYTVVGGTIKVFKPAPIIAAKPLLSDSMKVEFKNGKLSLDIKGVDISVVLRHLVSKTSKTLVGEQGLRRAINIFVKEVPFDKAVRLLAQTNGLILREREGVYTFSEEMTAPKGGRKGGSRRGRMWVKVNGNKLNLELKGVDISRVVQEILEQSGVSSVNYGNLKGKATAKLKDVSIEQAFQFLFRETDFTYWIQNDVYFIGPRKLQKAASSRLIPMKHTSAEEILKQLPREIKEGISLELIKGQNALMALGSYEKIDAVEEYIKEIDLPVPMILIEALVVDINLDKIRSYGLDLFLGDASKVASAETIYPAVNQVVNGGQLEDFFDGLPGLKDVVSLPKNFVAQINALEREKILKVRSRPQIATLNGQTASLTIGQTQYFLLKSETDFNQSQSLTSRSTERFEKIEADVKLTVTPYVTGDGEVTCEILPDFSEPSGSFDANVPPTINRRSFKSTVRLRENETIILGGIIKETENDVHTQLPFLGSIPYLGWLFKNVTHVTTRSQLMIFVTPHIYYGSDANVDVGEYLETLQ